MEITPVAKIRTDFPTKFGIPRQSGITANKSVIVFEKPFRSDDAIRGIEGYSHLWLIWEFSEARQQSARLTVRPPRLGGNTRIGVFASRSPFRPNNIGLSCVRFERIEKTPDEGDVLIVSGVDLLDMTPIYDIKPYIPYADCHEDAVGGYADRESGHRLDVVFPDEMLELIPDEKRQAASDCLADDPRPAYQNDTARIYSMAFAGFDIRFTIDGDVLRVTEVVRR